MSTRAVQLLSLGTVEYEDGTVLQKRLREARLQGAAPDTLILLEHPSVVTLGRGAKRQNLRWSEAQFRERGVQVVETERGGDVTYHGPGQLVGYPILDLAPDRKDVRRYVRDLEETLIRTLATFDIPAHREAKWPGVWVGSAEEGSLAKIAALGVHLSRWVTLHGFALNVTSDLSHFQSIVPCGIREADVTSLQRVLGARGEAAPSMAEVRARLTRAFSGVFDAQVTPAEAPRQTVSVFATRETTGGAQLLLLRRTPERGGFWQPVTGKVEPGEPPEQAALRELREETGASLTVQALDYVHAFGFGDALPPLVLEESAWHARWPQAAPPVALSVEHDLMEWVTLPVALERLPFAGLREGARRAFQRAAT